MDNFNYEPVLVYLEEKYFCILLSFLFRRFIIISRLFTPTIPKHNIFFDVSKIEYQLLNLSNSKLTYLRNKNENGNKMCTLLLCFTNNVSDESNRDGSRRADLIYVQDPADR